MTLLRNGQTKIVRKNKTTTKSQTNSETSLGNTHNNNNNTNKNASNNSDNDDNNNIITRNDNSNNNNDDTKINNDNDDKSNYINSHSYSNQNTQNRNNNNNSNNNNIENIIINSNNNDNNDNDKNNDENINKRKIGILKTESPRRKIKLKNEKKENAKKILRMIEKSYKNVYFKRCKSYKKAKLADITFEFDFSTFESNNPNYPSALEDINTKIRRNNSFWKSLDQSW